MKNALYEKLESLLELNLNRKYKVLDIGCGHGELLGHLSGSMNSESVLVGIDEIENSVERAKENYPHLEFLHEKFTDSLSFEGDSFDIVVSVDALECIPNESALLYEVHRVLNHGGESSIRSLGLGHTSL